MSIARCFLLVVTMGIVNMAKKRVIDNHYLFVRLSEILFKIWLVNVFIDI
jgi:hypothetical protein